MDPPLPSKKALNFPQTTSLYADILAEGRTQRPRGLKIFRWATTTLTGAPISVHSHAAGLSITLDFPPRYPHYTSPVPTAGTPRERQRLSPYNFGQAGLTSAASMNNWQH